MSVVGPTGGRGARAWLLSAVIVTACGPGALNPRPDDPSAQGAERADSGADMSGSGGTGAFEPGRDGGAAASAGYPQTDAAVPAERLDAGDAGGDDAAPLDAGDAGGDDAAPLDAGADRADASQ